ncbi:hypothetical protein HBI07_251930 [Parastagonospora nodorum]|nr:hypothetical protein HBI07_251930 [Parastagonospora nodorum]
MRISEIGRLGLAWHAPGACFAVICAEVYSTNPSTDTKAADKDPTVGRLYHHLAILAKPNALQQLYYYSRSLTCVKPFPSARESILTLLDPILGRAAVTYSHALPIDTNYIKARTLLFEKLSLDDFEQVTTEFLDNLDNHIGRVTAKWEEQGVYIAVTNVASWFNYGVDDNPLRQVFLTELVVKAKNNPAALEEQLRTAFPEDELLSTANSLCSQPHFEQAKKLTFDTFALALRRVRDKNVLPHVHIMLLFLSTFASNKYVSHLLFDTPWAELVIQSQIQSQIDSLFSSPVFPNEGERSDGLPLPEDYLVRGLIWAHGCFPKKWFEREHDGEERCLELASTVKSRMERVLRLGYALASAGRWRYGCGLILSSQQHQP